MRRGLRVCAALIAIALVHDGSSNRALHAQATALSVTPTSIGAVRQWDTTVNQMLRTNELQIRTERPDTLVPGRTIQRLDQYYRGIPVWGGSVSRQLDGAFAV